MAERGRPTLRNAVVETTILEGLAAGTPLAVICRGEGMPNEDTVRDWGHKDVEFSRLIARAREAGFDQIALDALRIADFGDNDTFEDDDGNVRTNSEVIQRSKLRVETRLKLLAKWDPKRYGEMMKLGDPDGKAVAFSLIVHDTPRPK